MYHLPFHAHTASYHCMLIYEDLALINEAAALDPLIQLHMRI